MVRVGVKVRVRVTVRIRVRVTVRVKVKLGDLSIFKVINLKVDNKEG